MRFKYLGKFGSYRWPFGFFFIWVLFYLSPCSAGLLDYSSFSYPSGLQLRQANPNLVAYERGFVVDVPLDYANPARGQTQIYAYFSRPYNPDLPTFAIMLGGPGQHSHHHFVGKFELNSSLPFNFLLFDQRGVGFSRLATAELAADARNFSSENTARDLERILTYLNIPQIALLGVSYGSIPATIFAHFFPERTRSLVLEGVVFSGWDGVLGGDFNLQLLQELLARLPEATQRTLTQLIRLNVGIDEAWFPNTLLDVASRHGDFGIHIFLKAVQEGLGRGLIRSEEIMENYVEESLRLSVSNEEKKRIDSHRSFRQQQLQLYYPWETTPSSPERLLNGLSLDIYGLLMVKELGINARNPFHPGHYKYTLSEGRFEKVRVENVVLDSRRFAHLVIDSYSAHRYPVRVPIYYVQGGRDTSSVPLGAFEHYHRAAKGRAQLFLFSEMGHLPVGHLLKMAERGHGYTSDDLKSFLKSMFLGREVAVTSEGRISELPGVSVNVVSKGHFSSASRVGDGMDLDRMSMAAMGISHCSQVFQ